MKGKGKAEKQVLPREGIRIQSGYHSPQLDVKVKLNTNESPAGPPDNFSDALVQKLNTISWNRYPDRRATALRSALAELHGVVKENVFVANGSNEVLQTILLAYGGHQRTAAVFEPTYLLYNHICNLTSTNIIGFPRKSDFSIDLDRLDDVFATSPDIIFICSPNNPTGKLEETEVLTEILQRSKALVVVDEAYGQFSSFSAVDLLSDYKSLIVVRTYSKTWALAGLRLGYALCDQAISDVLWEVALPYHLDSFKQAAGEIALRDAAAMQERVAFLVSERERISEGLLQMGFDVVASQANFILFGSEVIDAKLLWHALVEQGILVRDVTSFPKIGNRLRVTVGSHDENSLFLKALQQIIREKKVYYSR
jgi:histidinol-phosphate aminotransferase